jgi:hypothetical protein
LGSTYRCQLGTGKSAHPADSHQNSKNSSGTRLRLSLYIKIDTLWEALTAANLELASVRIQRIVVKINPARDGAFPSIFKLELFENHLQLPTWNWHVCASSG